MSYSNNQTARYIGVRIECYAKVTPILVREQNRLYLSLSSNRCDNNYINKDHYETIVE